MNAGAILISGIFNGSRLLEVPFYQRAYVWQEEQWDRFLEDMEFVTSTKRQYFLGSIILKNGESPSMADVFSDRKIIIDGQQRLTTLMIFLKVYCLKCQDNNLFDRMFRLRDNSLSLIHGKNDISAFQQVMSQDKAESITNMGPESQIISAYNYFVKNLNPEKLNINIINQKVQFVYIELDENEDEQQVFDTINSLGVRLTTSELLKNYFFQRNNVDEYEDSWISVFEKDDETRLYWEQELETGRMKRSLIDIFFDAFFQMFIQDKQYNVASEDKIVYARVDHLAKSYQDFINKYCDGDKDIVLSLMSSYAKCFEKALRPELCNTGLTGSAGIERINVIIFGLNNTTLIPYVLYLEHNVDDVNERNKMYALLESYIMRRMIVHASTKNYNNLFTSFILNKVCDYETLKLRLTKSKDATSYMPNNEEVLAGFKYAKLVNLQTKGILYFIESALRPSRSSTALYGFNSYSLEHLMPKKWRNNWTGCANEELERIRDVKLLTLGNLAIIPQSLNASIRDSSWTTKKTGTNQNNPGLEICASGLYTLHDALQKVVWNESEIDARAEWLYEQAITLWNYQVELTALQEEVQDTTDEFVEVFPEVIEVYTDEKKEGSEKKERVHQKMTDEMILACYKYGKELYKGKNLNELVEAVVEETGMTRSSVVMYLYAVCNMLEGIVYKRAISGKATEVYLKLIFEEYGCSGLEKALHAIKEHVKYREIDGYVVDSIKRICVKYEEKL